MKLKTAIKKFLVYAEQRGIRRHYEVLPKWLEANYPEVISQSSGFAALKAIPHKNDFSIRELSPEKKKAIRSKRTQTYYTIFGDALGSVYCANCGADVRGVLLRFGKCPPPLKDLFKTEHHCDLFCAANNPSRLEKTNKTCMARYGTLFTSQADSWKESVKASFTRRYGEGVTNPSHIPEVLDKILKNRYGRYEVVLKGKTFNTQGYEDVALRWLVEVKGIAPRNIETDMKLVGHFPYIHLGKDHQYFPDVVFTYKGTKYIGEVKSVATLASTRAVALRLLAKARAMWELSDSYRVFLCSEKHLLAIAHNMEELKGLIIKHRRTW